MTESCKHSGGPAVSSGAGRPLPSAWVVNWTPAIPAGGRALDVAAGSGRHSLWLASQGLRVTAVDRDVAALGPLSGNGGIELLEADLEQGPWPYAAQGFDGIVVTNYLHRPLFPHLIEALASGGVLIYETFMAGNERYGRPSNPAFLLRPNELLESANSLQVLAFEQGYTEFPKPAMVQRICARRR